MTYQQAIADVIKLFLTTDVDAVIITAAIGSGSSSFCPAAADAATIPTSSVDVDAAITIMIIAAATTGSGLSFSFSSAVDAVTTAAANLLLIQLVGSSFLDPLVMSDIYQKFTS